MPDPSDAKPVTPPSNLASLRARLRNHARDVSQVETRVQRRLAALVVNEIFLAADLGIDGPPVLIKGGTAIDLRRGTAPSRPSKDLDAAVRGDLNDFIAQARSLLDTGWSGFTGRLARETEIEVPDRSSSPADSTSSSTIAASRSRPSRSNSARPREDPAANTTKSPLTSTTQ